MVIFLIIGFMIFLPNAALAEENKDISVICNHINQDTTKSADYIPGVDIDGNTVAGADLPNTGSPFINNPVTIPIELDIVERYGINLPAGVFSEPQLANINIHGNGKVTYNDRDVTAQFTQACVQQKTENKDKILPQKNGQRANDAVPSSDKIEGEYPVTEPSKPAYNN